MYNPQDYIINLSILGNIWNNLLFFPVLNLLLVLYHLLGTNLGWAIIAFTVVMRIALIPSVKSQTEMTQKMAGLKPELDKLQKQYANNQEKLVQEQMALYKRVGYNPVGCLGSLVPQILILYVMIQVINVVTHNNFNGIYPFIKSFVFGTSEPLINTGFYFIDLSKNFNGVVKEFGYSLQSAPYLVLALMVGIVQYFSTKFMQLMQNPTPKKKKPGEEMTQEEMQAQMMGSMNSIFPIMTTFISLSTPAVLGVYWFVQSLLLIVQYFFIDKEKSIVALKNLMKFDFKLNKNK